MSFNPELLKIFVKTDLGCKCPDDVFNLIKYDKHIKLEINLEVDRIITIGNRLLIFIFNVKDLTNINKTLERLVHHGRTQRDDECLNRYRLVLVTTKNKKLEKKIGGKFKNLAGVDDKIHLHIKNKRKFKEEKSFLIN